MKKAKEKIIFVKFVPTRSAPKWATPKRATTKQAASKWTRHKVVYPHIRAFIETSTH